MLPGMHLFYNHNWVSHKFKSQLQSEYTTDCVGQTWIQPEQWRKRERQRPGSRTVSRYNKGGDYLGGCGGGQLLHCRESESDGVVSWCRWVWMTGLPLPLRRRRWRRADASGMGSPAQQPLNGTRGGGGKEEACFLQVCLGTKSSEQGESGSSKQLKYILKSLNQKPEMICNHLQLLSNSENSFTEVERECVCTSETDT